MPRSRPRETRCPARVPHMEPSSPDWEARAAALREASPPFTPTVLSETDTQHFDEFEPGSPADEVEPSQGGGGAAQQAPTGSASQRERALSDEAATQRFFAGFHYRRGGA